jgi:hypothetical protein
LSITSFVIQGTWLSEPLLTAIAIARILVGFTESTSCHSCERGNDKQDKPEPSLLQFACFKGKRSLFLAIAMSIQSSRGGLFLVGQAFESVCAENSMIAGWEACPSSRIVTDKPKIALCRYTIVI